MKLSIEMPIVARCSVNACAYNVNAGCHARAITIGHGRTPGCDTFLDSQVHTHAQGTTAGVGACKVSDCVHNKDFECSAAQISVGHAGAGLACLTYASN